MCLIDDSFAKKINCAIFLLLKLMVALFVPLCNYPHSEQSRLVCFSLTIVCCLVQWSSFTYGCCAGGFPDLLLWDLKARTAKLSEVKGPRDRLSDQQRALIMALTAAGLDVEVFKVSDK